MPLRQLMNPTQQAAIARDVSECEIKIESLGIQLARAGRIDQQRLELGREGQGSIVVTIEQRLFARSIARQKHPAFRSIVQRERKHSVQPAQTLIAPLEICLENYFGVGCSAE